MKALVFEQFGGPEVLQYREIPDPVAKDDEVIVQMKAIGLNFADIYRRKGNYHLAGQPPYILGYEGAGVVVARGKNVQGLQIGQRIGFADVPHANAELVAVPQDKAIPLPEGTGFERAASVLLQGLTAQYLVNDSYPVKPGDVALVHAAAGGVGQLLTQMIIALGGSVIGLTSSPEKAVVVQALGASNVLLYKDDWPQQVLALCGGVNVAYESVGSTLMQSFAATRKRGTVVFFGMAGADPAPIDPRMLMDTSQTLTGGDLWNVLTSYTERTQRAARLFELIGSGKIKVSPPAVFALQDGAAAHQLLESRKSTGKILLIP
ncbi:quinone oxidoreductase [Silvimonas sp.]|uniref:quinone oxidoreductase family protein n=1 Tax=Silvimonas sp. TaxID=2650811 RepID=UPI00283F6263|nr:quinone oxidoreductase [Silvimonas sp.]MDR3426552.1 quinone oxidoreductase [Silvimonas sp.]